MRFRSFVLGALTMLVLVVVLFWAVADWPAPDPLPVRSDPVVTPTVLPVPASAAPPAASIAAAVDSQHTAPTIFPDSARRGLPVPQVGQSARLTTPVPPLPPAGPSARSPAPLPPLPQAAQSGPLIVPAAGVRPSDLIDTYEQARSQGRRHDAIDIPAPRGAPVLAVAAGTVAKLFLSERGGIALYHLAPDKHTIYYYAHMDRYADGIVEGKTLHPGDVIGYVGNTGNAGAGNYHLHFGISTTADPKQYWGGTPQNPYSLLRQGIGRPR